MDDIRTVLECECCSARVDILHDVVTYSDEAVAKALMVSEVARIAKLEQRMREFLLGKWRVRVQEASRLAGARVAAGGKLSQAYTAVDKVMRKWAPETAPRFGDDAGKCYKLARKAGAKKASGKSKASLSYQVPNFTQQLPEKVTKAAGEGAAASTVATNFTLVDAAAISDLEKESAVWIGRHYGANVRESVRAAVTPATIEGLSSRKAGAKIQEVLEKSLKKVTLPGGYNGSDASYFEGLAANTVTNARVRGQIRSFQEYEVTRYEIMNPMDSRTSRQCVHMNGKIFLVQQAVRQMERVSGVFEPDKIKKLHPWMGMAQLQAISPKPGLVGDKDAKQLADAGLSLPTYHFRCRSTVDVSFS